MKGERNLNTIWKRLRALVCIVPAAVLAVGCSSEPLVGEVVGKEYEPMSTYMVYMPAPSSNGQVVMVPTTQVDPECYRLDVVRTEGEKAGKVGAVCVSAADFEAAQPGDYYDGILHGRR